MRANEPFSSDLQEERVAPGRNEQEAAHINEE
jgi:hypothetical protein